MILAAQVWIMFSKGRLHACFDRFYHAAHQYRVCFDSNLGNCPVIPQKLLNEGMDKVISPDNSRGLAGSFPVCKPPLAEVQQACQKPSEQHQGSDTWSDTRVVNRYKYCTVGVTSMTAAYSMTT